MKTIRNLKRRLIAVFFAFIALFHFRNNGEGFSWKKVMTALASPFAVFSGCKNEPDGPNKAPTAVAEVTGGTLVNGRYEFDFTLPANRAIQLNGSGTDTDGKIASYAWACTDKPGDADIPTFDSTAKNPTVNGFDQLGDYEFTLKVKDNNGAESEGAVVKVSLYRIASATIGVNPINFGVDEKLDFTPAYTSTNTNDFPIADIGNYITYTVTATNNNYNHTFVVGEDGFDGKILPRNEYESVQTTFNQVFNYNDGQEKSRSLKVIACGGSFVYFGDSYSDTESIPTLADIQLNKKVTVGNIP